MVTRVKRHPRRTSFGWRAKRTGLTTLEFAGCVIAVVGGLWIGAIYLGVDMRHLAHRVLDEAELLDRVPDEWRPTGPNDNTMTREQVVAMLRKELGSLRSEIVALRTAAAVVGDPELLSEAEARAKEKTRSYWQRLSEIAQNEAMLQSDAEMAFDERNAAKVFAIKGRIGNFAANAVEAVPSDGVDPILVQFGQQLGAWYKDAGELYERAVHIWESPTANQARSQLNRDWRAAELQHRNEARLLNERAAAVCSSLSRRYSEELPEFAKPLAPRSPEATVPATAGEGPAEAAETAPVARDALTL